MTRVAPIAGTLLACALVIPPAGEATSYVRRVRPLVEEIDLRELPSLIVEWQWEGTVEEWTLEDGIAYVVGGPRLTALDARTGEELWRHDLERECACSKLAILPTRIAAGIDGRAVLIDRASGALAADLPLGESITALIPEPLIFAYRGPLELSGLVLLDEESGVEIGRYSPPGGVSSVERIGDRLIVQGAADEGSGAWVRGLDLSLIERWSREVSPRTRVRREGDALVLATWQGARESLQEIDLATGGVKPWKRGEDEGEPADEEVEVSVLAPDLTLLLATDEPPLLVRLRRGGRDSARWRTELPVVVDAAAEGEGRLVVAQQAWGGAGVVMVLDADDGTILARAAGLRGMQAMHPFDELLVTQYGKGLAAVRLDSFGPSAASTTTLEEAVAAILAELAPPDPSLSTYTAKAELEKLGPAALPYLADAIGEVTFEVVAMIAGLVVDGGYRPATAPLAARLASFLQQPTPVSDEEKWATSTYLGQIGRAVAELASAREVPLLERLLKHDSVEGYLRLTVLASLGRLAPEKAGAELERLRAAHPAEGSWWRSPAAAPWVEAAALEVDPAALQELVWSGESYEETERLMRGARAALAEEGEERWVLFQETPFQAAEYWAARLEEDGTVGVAAFVGSIPSYDHDPEEPFAPPVLAASLTDGLLEVGYVGSDSVALTLDELVRDSDDDGLTDRLETFIGLDPRAADSDGDGSPDPLDFAPRGEAGDPRAPEEAALLALHETLALVGVASAAADEVSAAEPFYAFLADAPALEWRAGPIATFLLPASEGCRAATYRLTPTAVRPLEPSELAVEVVRRCEASDESEHGEVYVLRSTPVGWVLSGTPW